MPSLYVDAALFLHGRVDCRGQKHSTSVIHVTGWLNCRGEWLLVEQFFSGNHQLGWLHAQRTRELENSADGRLVLAGFNQGDEISLHAGFKRQLLLTQPSSPPQAAQGLPKSGMRTGYCVSRHIGKLWLFR